MLLHPEDSSLMLGHGTLERQHERGHFPPCWFCESAQLLSACVSSSFTCFYQSPGNASDLAEVVQA